MKASVELDRILTLLQRAEELNDKVEVLPEALADKLGYLIEAIQEECYYAGMDETA